MTLIRVFLADNHAIFREGLRSYLSTQPGLAIVGEAADGRDALDKIAALAPHVALMEISMPGLNAIDATCRLQHSGVPVKVLILSVHDEREYLLESFRAGAKGYLLKDSAPSDVLRAIEAVHAGDPFYTVGTTRLLLEHADAGTPATPPAREELTTREREILRLACEGLKSSEIAQQLVVSIRTVDAHRRNIKRKLGVHTMAGLTRYALMNGLIRMR